jgi:hypothetical protein
MRKGTTKGFILGMVFTLMLVSTVNVFGASVGKAIDVVYNNIKIVVDGKPVSFGKDSAGNNIEPFIYNGTTYLPVRAVGEAIGKKVDWDGATQTVYLGEKPGEVSYLTETIEPYSKSYTEIYTLNNPDKLSMGGVKYNTGYKIGGRKWSNDKYNYMHFNLNSQYSEISGYVGTLGNETTLDIYLDGKLYDSITIEKSGLPREFSIPVTGVNQVTFDAAAYYTALGLGDLIIK